MSESDTIDGAQVHSVDHWGPPTPQLVCPAVRDEPEPCSCGFVGRWEHRWVYTWHVPTRWPRSASEAARTEGWKVLAGYDERCPGCGDVERFDLTANRVATFVEQAQVVRFMGAYRSRASTGEEQT